MMFLDDLDLDWKTRLPLLLQPNTNYRLGPPRLAHLLAEEYVEFKYVDSAQFNSYFKFAIVRHPTTRVLSMYNYLHVAGTLDDFIMRWLPRQFDVRETYEKYPHRYLRSYHFVRPQIEFVGSKEGKCLVDKVYHFEDLEIAAQDLRQKFNLSSSLKHVNKSKRHSAGLDDLTPAHHESIERLYSSDFEEFGYVSKC